MKRSAPLQRRAPLARTGWGRRGQAQRKRKPAEIAHLPQEGCYPGQFFETPCGARSMTAHIGLTKQTLGLHWDEQERRRRWGLPHNEATLALERHEFIWDPRWIRRGCRHHHAAFDGPHFKLTRDQLPASVEQAAEEFGLSHRLRRDYGPRESIIERFEGAA